MNNSRIYFSRYFYSALRPPIKYVRFTSNFDFYFYSDPYYLNQKLNKYKRMQKISITEFQTFDIYRRSRNYFIPLKFFCDDQVCYDFSWHQHSKTNVLFKFFSIFLRFRISPIFSVNFFKIYNSYNFFKILW